MASKSNHRQFGFQAVWIHCYHGEMAQMARLKNPEFNPFAIPLLWSLWDLPLSICPSWKFFKSVHNGLIGRPLFFKTAHKMGHQIHELAFFYKKDPIWIWILCKKKLKIFQIGPLWYDWQTPQNVQNCPQYSKYLWKIAGHKYCRGPKICHTNFTST